jgi:Uma2 family endonuclease
LTASAFCFQFRTLQEPPHAYYELRHGEVCEVTRPRYGHIRIQRLLRDRLNALAGNRGVADTELPLCPLAEHELWVADVAYLSSEREAQARGEVRSRAAFCLSTGSLEFWVVDPVERTVTV